MMKITLFSVAVVFSGPFTRHLRVVENHSIKHMIRVNLLSWSSLFSGTINGVLWAYENLQVLSTHLKTGSGA